MGKQEAEEIETPAIVRADHAQDRELTTVAGGPRGWRKLSPLQRCHENGQITQEHFDAGTAYSAHFDLAMCSGRNILDPDRVFGSGDNSSLSQVVLDASRALALIEKHMGNKDKALIQMVCGEGRWPSEAMQIAFGNAYTKATMPRFREALDALIAAMAKARRRPQLAVVNTTP